MQISRGNQIFRYLMQILKGPHILISHKNFEEEQNNSIQNNIDFNSNDSISFVEEFSDAEEIFEDIDLDFDPSYPPL